MVASSSELILCTVPDQVEKQFGMIEICAELFKYYGFINQPTGFILHVIFMLGSRQLIKHHASSTRDLCFFSAYLMFTLGSSHLFKYHAFIFSKYSFMITAKLQLEQLIVNSLVLLHIICIVCRVVSWSMTFMLRLAQGLFSYVGWPITMTLLESACE